MNPHEKAVEAAMNTLVRTDGAYPGGEPTAHLSDWFDLDAQDAMEFGAIAEPKWHSYSDIRVEQYEAYIAAVLKAPFTAAVKAYLASMREQGWVMVPVEPASFEWTDAMYAAFNAIQAQKSHPYPEQLRAVFVAMLEAAKDAQP